MTVHSTEPESFLAAVYRNLESIPDQRLLTFLANGEDETDFRNFRQLDREARRFALILRERGALPGDRVLLALPGELPFLSAFLGCLYAGLIAVPAHPPRIHKGRPDTNLNRIRAIIQDCEPKLAIMERATGERMLGLSQQFPELGSVACIFTDEHDAFDPELFRREHQPAERPAFLQYTSGSTAEPKGVILTHGNLYANLAGLNRATGETREDRKLSWLPFFHDLGLIGNLLFTLYVGCECVVLPPVTVLQKPIRWLRAVSRYRSTTSGGPNFAYELCIEAIGERERSELDLSSWRIAYNGAEPLRAGTLQEFERLFAPAGFGARVMAPCYGLAESTLMVATAGAGEGCTITAFDREGLTENRALPRKDSAVNLVSCGIPRGEAVVRIVDPDSLQPVPDGNVGELWIQSESVSPGYWNKGELNRAVFGLQLPGEGGGFLRSGDLGFFHAGELYITGRLKDLIIVNGRNIYPQDLELCAKQAHALTHAGTGAAFAQDAGAAATNPAQASGNGVIVVQEVHRRFRPEQGPEIVRAIRGALAEAHELHPAAVVLVKFGAVPRTTSGKVRRRSCSQKLAAGELAVVFRDDHSEDNPAESGPDSYARPGRNKSKTDASRGFLEIRNRLINEIAGATRSRPDDIETNRPFSYLGLTSVLAVQLVNRLETWLERTIPPAVVFDYNTIDELAEYLAADAAAPAPASDDVAKTVTQENIAGEQIAIVGIGCRFPGGAVDTASFWKVLREGRDCVQSVPDHRWFDGDPERLPRGGFLDEIADFDPAVFGISPREAERMDPQQRLLIETTYEALEDAGFDPFAAAKRTGVYVGISGSEYALRQLSHESLVDARTHTGGALSLAANRLSYIFGFNGPSMSVDTACSSSLVALHLACEELRRNPELDLCIAGGANLLLTSEVMAGFERLGVLSPAGRCRPFDARADGIVRGEGVGVLCLQRLSEARRTNAAVYGVVAGSAVNQDGRSFGLTAPNGLAQQAMLRDACRRANIAPTTIDYVEAHGTGTALGDPVEAGALGQVYGAGRAPGEVCSIGSVKSNLGHLEAAAGVAGVIKAALMLHHKRLVPSLHFETPNSEIDFEALALRVQTADEAFPANGRPRRVGVSGFGFGGTNAHVILEEAPSVETFPESSDASAQTAARGEASPALLIPLAGFTASGLRRKSKQLADWLGNHETKSGDVNLYDLAYTCATKQKIDQAHRLAVQASSVSDLREKLSTFATGATEIPGLIHDEAPAGDRAGPGTVFVFAGQGAKFWPLPARQYANEPAFARELARCADALRELTDVDLLDELEGGESSVLNQARYMQPALFAIQMALVALWAERGVRPDAVLGHSMGEVAAACTAGALDLNTAIRILYHRGRLVEQTTGRMALIALAEDQVRTRLHARSDISIAAVLAPSSVVVSGEADAVDRLITAYETADVFARPLESVSFASHSPRMEPLIGPFLESLSGGETATDSMRFATPRLPMFSTVTGERIPEDRVLGPEYWAENLRQPVRFYPALQTAREHGLRCFVEMSPHPNLLPAIRETLRTHALQSDARGASAIAVSALHRDRCPGEMLREALGAMYVQGTWRNFSRLYPRAGRQLRLPPYPFERKRYWLHMLDHLRPHPGPVQINGAQTAALETDETESPVSRFYDALAAASPDGSAYLTFGPFERVREDFSWIRAFAFPHRYPDQFEALRNSQLALRDKLLAHVDFTKARRVLDFGCGHGTDLSVLAEKHRDIRCDGFTLSARQRARGIEQSHRRGVQDRVRIFQMDSSRDPFPGMYDVAFGFEVAGHIQDKDALFSNLSKHLVNGGYCLLADFISHSLSEIQIDSTASYSATVADWAGVLARHQFRISVSQDISAAISNFLYAPNFEQDVEELGGEIELSQTVRDYLVSYRNLGTALSRGFLSYVLLTLRKDALAPEADLLIDNLRQLSPGRDLTTHAGHRIESAPVNAPMHYHLRWVAQPLPAGGAADSGAAFRIICEDEALAPALRAAAKRSSLELTIVSSMEALNSLESRNAAGSSDDDDAQIVYIAPQPADHMGNPGSEMERLCRDFLSLFQKTRARLWLVTRGCAGPSGDEVQQARQSEAINPDPRMNERGADLPLGALLWGLGRSLREEEPGRAGALLDMDPEAEPAAFAERLLAELQYADSANEGAQELAYRAGVRYVPRLIPDEGAESNAAGSGEAAQIIRPDGAYLVTGGSGDLGRLTIEHLIALGARHIVVLSRTATRNSLEDLMRKHPGIIVTAACDVADGDALRKLAVDRKRRGLPAIRGIVHAAGVHEDLLLHQLDQESMLRVLAPKVLGAFHLHRVFSEGLDFFVSYSSASAVLARPGQGSYSAANAFLDAFAQFRRRLDLPAVSIGWGPWRDMGFARSAGGARLTAHLERLGISALDPEYGMQSLQRALGSPGFSAHWLVLDVDWKKFRTYHPAAERSPLLTRVLRMSQQMKTQSGQEHQNWQARFRASPVAKQREILEDYLREHTARVLRLGKHEVDPERPLNQMGLDSLMAVELKNLIEGEFQIPVPVARMFRGAGIRDMAAFLSGETEHTIDIDRGDAAPRDALRDAAIDLPLLPVQRWFFEQANPVPDHWNVSGLITFPGDADPAILERATDEMIRRHESLRVRFALNSRGDRVQRVLPMVSVPFRTVQLNAAPGPERSGEISRIVANDNAGLDLAAGPVFRVAYLRGAAREQGRLLLVLHHVIADGFGIALFFREFLAIYESLRHDRELPPGAPGPALGDYTRALARHADSPELSANAAVWEALIPTDITKLPRDYNHGALREVQMIQEGERQSVETLLDAKTTERLLSLADQRGTGLETLLLAAVVQSFTQWSGNSKLAVSCEHHGRDGGAVEAGRLLTWCSSMFPLSLERGDAIDQTLAKVQDRMAAVPTDRAGYGVMRYMSADPELRRRMEAAGQPEIKLLYHGNLFEHIRSAIQPHAVAPEPRGPIYDGRNRPRHLIYVYGALLDECLRVEIAYMRTLFQKQTMESVLQNLRRALRDLVRK